MTPNSFSIALTLWAKVLGWTWLTLGILATVIACMNGRLTPSDLLEGAAAVIVGIVGVVTLWLVFLYCLGAVVRTIRSAWKRDWPKWPTDKDPT